MTMLPFEDDQVSLDGENTPDEPVTDAAGQTVTADDDDAPLTDADLAHAKHAAAIATGQASVAPPPIEAPPDADARLQRNRRKDAGKPRAPRKPRSMQNGAAPIPEPSPEPEPRITGHQEIISTSDAQVIIDHKAGQALYVGNREPGIPCHDPPLTASEFNRQQVDQFITNQVAESAERIAADNFIHLPEVHHDYKALAKKKLKTFGKFAARAVAAAQLWPKDPARYFDTVGKIFVDLATDEDRGVIDALVLNLLPKSTIDAIERSGVTVI